MNNAETDDRLKEIFELSRLYDLYGSLLNQHTRDIFEDYIFNNYSLSEIADELDMTRQGVRDIVVRGSKKLKEYEEKLNFLEKSSQLELKLEKIRESILNGSTQQEVIEQLVEVSNIFEI